jgi:hypothetical protein
LATVKYDNSDVDTGGGGTGVPVPTGVRSGHIVQVLDRRDDGKNDLQVIVNFGDDWDWVYSYLNFGEASRWKFREWTDAMGLKPKGQFDPEKLSGKAISAKITHEMYEGEPRARIRRWLKPGDEEEEEEAETEDEEEEEEEEEVASADGETNYDEWTVEDLIEEINERELEVPTGRKTAAKLSTVLYDDDASKGNGTVEEAEEAVSDDYDEWPANELKDEAEERGLDLPDLVKGRGAAAKNKKSLIALLREDDKEEPF